MRLIDYKTAVTSTTTAHPTVTASVTVWVSATTTVYTTASTTFTATSTVTSTAIAIATASTSQFILQANTNAEYAQVNSGENGIAKFSTSASGASVFTLDGSCHLVEETPSVGFLGDPNSGTAVGPVFFDSEADIEYSDSVGNSYAYVVCSISAGTDQLDCTVNGNSVNSIDSYGVWYIGSSTNGHNPLTITVVPA